MNIIEVAGNAFPVSYPPTGNSDENVMFAMFTFDDIWRYTAPRGEGVEAIEARGNWMIRLCFAVSRFYGVNPDELMKEWANYTREF